MNNQGLRNLTGKSSIYLHGYWERGEKRDKWTSAFPFHPVNHLIGLLLNRLKTGRRPRVSSLISLSKAFAANITSVTKFSEKSLNKEFFGIKSQNSFFFMQSYSGSTKKFYFFIIIIALKSFKTNSS